MKPNHAPPGERHSEPLRSAALILALLVLVAATMSCAVFGGGGGADEPGLIYDFLARLEATSPGTGVGGSVEAVTSGSQTIVEVRVRSAEPEVLHPWHVHLGSCATRDGRVVGEPDRYRPIETDETGDGEATVTLNLQLDPSTNYHVDIHASPDDRGEPIACGDLNPQF